MDKIIALSIREGSRTPSSPKDGVSRVFSVVLTRATADLAVVVAAIDPTGNTLPAAGSVHPDDPHLVARPPIIYPVNTLGRLAATRFFNVRVPYVFDTTRTDEN